MTLTVATTSVPGNLEQKFEAISRAGFDGVELYEPDLTGYAGSPVEAAALAKSYGLEIDVFHPFHQFEGLSGADRDAAIARLQTKLQLLQALGAKLLLVDTTTHVDATDDFDAICCDFKVLADAADKFGIRAAIIALPWARHTRTELDALKIVEAVDSPHLGLALNSYFSLADGSQAARLRNIPCKHIFHVQLSDAHNIGADTRQLKSHLGLLPGQGSLNLESFVRVIARLGYKGPWSIVRTSNELQQSGENFARDAFRSLVNLLDGVSRNEPNLEAPVKGLPKRVHASGFEFIEFAADAQSGKILERMLESLCFRKERAHVAKSVALWRQGAVNFVVNTEKTGFAAEARKGRSATVCDMGLRVKDAAQTVARATALGAPKFSQKVGVGELDIPAIRGVGGNIVHFIDEQSDLHYVWDIEFKPAEKTKPVPPAGLRRIDHVAQTMNYQEMQSWLTYYTSTFEMSKTPIVDVADPSGIVLSQALSSPEGEVRMNLNGATDTRTFAGAFLADSFGAGVQHIAILTDDIFETSNRITAQGFDRLTISPNYYADIAARFSLDTDFIEKLRAGNILYDRAGKAEYFQIYSTPIFDGFFFEIVQRKGGYDGYGARNAPIRLAAQNAYFNQRKSP